MNNSQKTTEFSAHLSWAAMRRHLHEKLSSEESQRVDTHLQHCPRCSSAIIDYIQTEEPENYKQHMKKLKGNLKASQTAKKRLFSALQLKAIRTSMSVIALLIFSFFAVKTVMNKQEGNHALPSESLASVKSPAKTTPVRRRAVNKPVRTIPTEAAPAAEVAPKAAPEKKTAPKQVKKEVVVPKESTSPPAAEKTQPEEPRPQPAAPAAKEVAPAQEETTPAVAAPPSSEPATESAPQESAPSEEPEQETAKAKPVPTLEKLDAKKSIQPVAPLGGTRPPAIPVPGSQIRER